MKSSHTKRRYSKEYLLFYFSILWIREGCGEMNLSNKRKKNKSKSIRKKIIMCFTAAGALVGSAFFGIHEIRASIPDKIYVAHEDEKPLEKLLDSPFIQVSDSVTAAGDGGYVVECRLFDFIPLKQVAISQADPMKVYVSGEPIGVYMEMDGILVIDTQEILSGDGQDIEPARGVIQPGDYIQKINGTIVEEKDDLVSIMENWEGGNATLEIVRDNNAFTVDVNPVFGQDGAYKLGIWVRDNTQGIGTLTYVTQTGVFGALGHGISDTDMGQLLKLGNGDLYQAQILSVTKGIEGRPGELAGVIRYEDSMHLGKIEKNDLCGIYGMMDSVPKSDEGQLEVAYKQEIETGPATVLCTVDEKIQAYDILIEEIYWDASNTNKCFVINVTDNELIEKTGGIVQGMSGSPIIQNGKFIGAVTHVFVNDPTKGYGIFAETMLECR